MVFMHALKVKQTRVMVRVLVRCRVNVALIRRSVNKLPSEYKQGKTHNHFVKNQ